MSDKPSSPPGGSEQRRQPKQHRSVETRNSILDAACALFDEQGYEKTTTHQIAARADVSVGALYRYFSDKEAVLKEVYRREMSVLRDRILSEFSTINIVDTDIRAMIREALARAFNIFSENARLRRVLSEQSRNVPELAELRRSSEEELYGTVANILAAVPEVQLSDTKTGAYLVALFCEAMIEDYLLYKPDHADFNQERLLLAATDFILNGLNVKQG